MFQNQEDNSQTSSHRDGHFYFQVLVKDLASGDTISLNSCADQ